MTTSTKPVLRPAEPDLMRFDRLTRTVHWTTAGLFAALMLTGAALYAGPVSTIVGHRGTVRSIHVVAGLALPVPLLAAVIGRWGRRLRDDLVRLGRWTAADRAWLRRSTRSTAHLGKFNPGQKVNAAFLGAAAVVMLGTGVILKWFSLVPLSWRVGATFVHDWFALAIWVSVGLHVLFALRDPVARRGMRRGHVTARWARTEHAGWYEEQTGRPADRFKQPGARAGTASSR